MKLAWIAFSLLALFLATPVHAIGAEKELVAACQTLSTDPSGAMVGTIFSFIKVKSEFFALIGQDDNAKAQSHLWQVPAEAGDYLVRENLTSEPEAHDLNRAEKLLIKVLMFQAALQKRLIAVDIGQVKKARVFSVTTDKTQPTTSIVQLQDRRGRVLDQILAGTLILRCL